MTIHTQQLRKLCLTALLTLATNAMAGNLFTMNGRVVELVPSSTVASKATTAASAPLITVKDVASGQVKVYASGLIITLKEVGTLQALLRDYPAIQLQYAPGKYAYVQVSSAALASTFDALSADPRVEAVHLRPVPIRIKPR
nr:hypothetical protein [uncultured Rhodoferax sp.]